MCFDTVGSVHQRIGHASVGMVAGRVRGMLWGGVPVLRQCGACASGGAGTRAATYRCGLLHARTPALRAARVYVQAKAS